MAESVKKRSEIEEQDTWKLEDMIESLEKFEELMDGVEERIQEYEAYREKLGNSAEYLKNYLTYDESVDETLSLLYACRGGTRIPPSARTRRWCRESSPWL